MHELHRLGGQATSITAAYYMASVSLLGARYTLWVPVGTLGTCGYSGYLWILWVPVDTLGTCGYSGYLWVLWWVHLGTYSHRVHAPDLPWYCGAAAIEANQTMLCSHSTYTYYFRLNNPSYNCTRKVTRSRDMATPILAEDAIWSNALQKRYALGIVIQMNSIYTKYHW